MVIFPWFFVGLPVHLPNPHSSQRLLLGQQLGTQLHGVEGQLQELLEIGGRLQTLVGVTLGGFLHRDTQEWLVYKGKSQSKMDDWG